MSARFDSWESYFYPETYDPAIGKGTLRNRFGEHDAAVLRVLEHGSTADRQAELMVGVVDVARTYDAAHVRAIHRYLFQDVYDWAGEYRTVNIAKDTPRGVRGRCERRDRSVPRGREAARGWHRVGPD